MELECERNKFCLNQFLVSSFSNTMFIEHFLVKVVYSLSYIQLEFGTVLFFLIPTEFILTSNDLQLTANESYSGAVKQLSDTDCVRTVIMEAVKIILRRLHGLQCYTTEELFKWFNRCNSLILEMTYVNDGRLKSTIC